MLFNSLHFILFFIFITSLYFALQHKYRWFLLLMASCYFYMVFIPVYILILGFTIVIDYFAGILIENAEGKKRRFYLILSLLANIGVLAIFKYYNLIIYGFTSFLNIFNLPAQTGYLSILLPVGLSFHTFQAMSYTIEVYRRKYKPEKHFGLYALYVMFYPQLVAGPIERPQHLLPQFKVVHYFDYTRITNGLKLMFWGFFQKLVIADNVARFVDAVYNNPSAFYGWDVIVATLFFSLQIYADFSGYTDIARGAAQVMGFNLMKNFRHPYFACSFRDFWHRWHISLSSWFRDYVYFSIGGSKNGKLVFTLAVILTFALSGLWHGANVTFVIWGIYHGFLYLAERIINGFFPGLSGKKFLLPFRILMVFTFTTLGWMIFRIKSVHDLVVLLNHMSPEYLANFKISFGRPAMLFIFLSSLILLFVWILEKNKSIVTIVSSKPAWQRWTIYIIAALWLIGVGNWGTAPFIYFQF
ncbi:MAG: MBOAT family O-acyltransferase [Bacteroidales bacterium]